MSPLPRGATLAAALLLCTSSGCAARSPAGAPGVAEGAGTPEDADAQVVVVRTLAQTGIQGLLCQDAAITLAVDGLAHTLEPTQLDLGAAGPAVRGPLVAAADGWGSLVRCADAPDSWCVATGPDGQDETPFSDPAVHGAAEGMDPARLASDWNRRHAADWRVRFQRHLPAPGGGVITYSRTGATGAARVMRIGGGTAVASAPAGRHDLDYPSTIALHPAGWEVYVLAWPTPMLVAYSADLRPAWRLDLGAPAVPLYLDPLGRLLVAELDAASSPERMLDYPPGPPSVPAALDPAGDAALHLTERPMGRRTAVVDLDGRRLAAELDGAYVGACPVPAAGDLPERRVLVATTSGLTELSVRSATD